MSAEVYVVAEGQTEQTFIRDVLAPALAVEGKFLKAALIGVPGHKGGRVNFERASKDICRYLKQRPDTYVSTMVDYYGLNTKWPGYSGIKLNWSIGDIASHIESCMLEEIEKRVPSCNAEQRFIPFIVMHEFEALLFSDTAKLAEKAKIEQQLIDDILTECGSPEKINNDPKTAPSKRLLGLNPSYRKIAMGQSVSQAIGIQTICEKCPLFSSWVSKLKQLP